MKLIQLAAIVIVWCVSSLIVPVPLRHLDHAPHYAPSLAATQLFNITFLTDPLNLPLHPGQGGFYFNGTYYLSRQSANFTSAHYNATATSEWFFGGDCVVIFTAWTSSGGLVISKPKSLNTDVQVVSSGNLTAKYQIDCPYITVAFTPSVTIVAGFSALILGLVRRRFRHGLFGNGYQQYVCWSLCSWR